MNMCKHLKIKSKRQAKQGFYECRKTGENIYEKNCEGCKDYESILKGMFKPPKMR